MRKDSSLDATQVNALSDPIRPDVSQQGNCVSVPPCIHSHERWKLVSTRQAHARISILSCMHCGWIDTEAAIEDALALASASASPHPETFSENETKDVLTALYQDGHVDLVLADRVAALMASKGTK